MEQVKELIENMKYGELDSIEEESLTEVEQFFDESSEERKKEIADLFDIDIEDDDGWIIFFKECTDTYNGTSYSRAIESVINFINSRILPRMEKTSRVNFTMLAFRFDMSENIPKKYWEEIIGVKDEYAWRWACHHGSLNSLEKLVAIGVDVSVRNYQGFRWACRGQCYDVVHYLLKLQGNYQHHPMMEPTFYEDPELARYLIRVFIDTWRIPSNNSNVVAIKDACMAKVDWESKIFKYCEKWKQELQNAEKYKEAEIRRAISDLLRLRGERKVCGDTLLQSEGIVTKDNLSYITFNEAVDKYLLSDRFKEVWHPGSDGKVLDIVHPSLDPIIHGIAPSKDWNNMPSSLYFLQTAPISSKYQWPAVDVTVDDLGNIAISGNIGNLSRDLDKAIYDSITSSLKDVLPAFEDVLNANDCYYQSSRKRSYDEDDSKHNKISLRNRKLQVIVKIAEIRLKKGESYPGGSWHVEGTTNEKIVASAVCYTDIQGIYTSRLAFRKWIDEFEDLTSYQQNFHDPVAEINDVHDSESTIKPIGSLQAKKGRCIVFFNKYQHKVLPFTAKSDGMRRILCYFLVDPANHISEKKDNSPPLYDMAHFEKIIEERKKVLLQANYDETISLCEH
ncbi:hypothetical protein TrispH2_009728 [Trichoplax sp. H2]|nr:hypothetical protein TrispH2_009728 [Trichoplax sp. H2]|eukprot:RDD37804.1 hypothetical protein TrispH2_009728 [Trichoplax sp. H2]